MIDRIAYLLGFGGVDDEQDLAAEQDLAPTNPRTGAASGSRIDELRRTRLAHENILKQLGGDGLSMYDAGQESRHYHGWTPAGLGPNAANDTSLRVARARVRQLVDDNPLIGGAREIMRNSIVGSGIRAMPATEWPDLNKQIEEIIEHEFSAVDVERSMAIDESQGLFFDEVFSAGDCLSHFPIAKPFEQFGTGPCIDLIDSERIDIDYDGVFADSKGRVRHGVEFDSDTRRVAFHVLREHPTDGLLTLNAGTANERDRIPSSDAILGQSSRRIKQVRGVPWPVRVVKTAKLEDSTHEAILLLRRAAASVGLWLDGVSTDKLAALSGTEDATAIDAQGNELSRMKPGMIGMSGGNAKATLLNPSQGGSEMADTTSMLLRRMAAGFGLSYSTFARDMSRASFAASRAEALEDRKMFRPLQKLVWRKHSFPHYWRVIRFNIAKGRIKLTAAQRAVWLTEPWKFYKHTMIAPGFDWVDPKKEAEAEGLSVAGYFTSPQRVAAAKGHDWREIIAEIAEHDAAVELATGSKPDRSTPAGSSRDDDRDTDEQETER